MIPHYSKSIADKCCIWLFLIGSRSISKGILIVYNDREFTNVIVTQYLTTNKEFSYTSHNFIESSQSSCMID